MDETVRVVCGDGDVLVYADKGSFLDRMGKLEDVADAARAEVERQIGWALEEGTARQDVVLGLTGQALWDALRALDKEES